MTPNRAMLLLAVLLALTSAAMASTTWYVNGVSGNDKNNCASPTTACKTIAHAISLAASGDVIKVAAATYTENLAISISLKILGSGAQTTILDGGGVGRVVTISSHAHFILSGVTITNGISKGGGGGIFNSGALTLVASTLTGNVAGTFCRSCNLAGGGIFNAVGANLTIRNNTVSGNEVELGGCSPGGACVVKGGGIYNLGTLALSNSTVSGNVLFGGFPEGGGIYNGGVATISNSTIAGNTGGFGGGISNSGTETIQNSIVANTPGNCFNGGVVNSLGYNLSSDDSCGFSNTGDLNNTDPLLGPLQYNGGPTQTMALPSGSPAIDAGNPNGCTDSHGHLLKKDQRGMPRPDKEDTAGCDMGAYERQSD